MNGNHYVSSKIFSYLKDLSLEYMQSGNSVLYKIIQNARVYVREGQEVYDGFNDHYYYYYDVLLFLDSLSLAEIRFKNRNNYCIRIKEDLETIKSVKYEVIDNVYLNLEDKNDLECQKSISIQNYIPIDAKTLSFWKPNHIRLFISHRAEYKREVKMLADNLENYGISSFVAHHAIEPMKKWPEEIIKSLETMEVMLAFITNNFDDSPWTNQEIGFALGQNIPVIALKLEHNDPSGFIQAKQALQGKLEDSVASASQIYKIMTRLIDEESLKSAFISKLLTSKDYSQSIKICKLMANTISSLSDDEVERIIRGFSENNQLYGSDHLKEPLCNFLKCITGKEYFVQDNKILPTPS